MNRPASVLLATLTLAGCSIDFVAVGERTNMELDVVSVHDTTGLQVRIWSVSEGPVPVRLVVNGREVRPHDALSGRFTYRMELTVDSLAPEIRVGIDVAGDDGIDLMVPAMVRTGVPSWLPTGELSVPVSFGDGFSSAQSVFWSATVLDADGSTIASIPDGPVSDPDRILISDSLLPAAAAALAIVCHGVMPGRVDPLTLDVAFICGAETAIPVRPPSSGPPSAAGGVPLSWRSAVPAEGADLPVSRTPPPR